MNEESLKPSLLLFSGLHFLQQKVDGTERLVSVCQSHSISKDQNGNICFGEKKFIPPKLGFNRIYYVTERDMQVEVNIFVKEIFCNFKSPPFSPRKWQK